MFLIYLIISCSCNLIKATKSKTANRDLLQITMTDQQQTDSIVSMSNQLKTIFKGFVYLGKNFTMDSTGRVELADTIYINAIITKTGKLLSIGVANIPHHGGGGIDTLIDPFPQLFNKD